MRLYLQARVTMRKNIFALLDGGGWREKGGGEGEGGGGEGRQFTTRTGKDRLYEHLRVKLHE